MRRERKVPLPTDKPSERREVMGRAERGRIGPLEVDPLESRWAKEWTPVPSKQAQRYKDMGAPVKFSEGAWIVRRPVRPIPKSPRKEMPSGRTGAST